MNYFVTFKEHKYTVQFFIEFTQPKSCAVISYEELLLQSFTTMDVIILCDIDRCDDHKVKEVINCYNKLKSIGCKVINNPKLVLRRFDLLKLLFNKNINQFNLFRISELNDDINYPVFIRNEYEHNGPESKLLDNAESLKKELLKLNNDNRNIVVEYIDTRKSNNLPYTKYGAFFLDGNIIPRHYFESQKWIVKGNSNKSNNQKEKDYMQSEKHNEFIRYIFELSNIQYGRIDYTETNTGFQVFEINTNPTILDYTDVDKNNPRIAISEMFTKQFVNVLENLNQ